MSNISLGGQCGLLYISSWAVANGLIGWLGAWEEQSWKIGEKDILGRDVWLDLSKWAKDVKIFVSRVNPHQMVTSAEEDDQIDRRVHSVHSIVSDFSSHSCHWPMGS